MSTYRFLVSGRVQGVGFRAFVVRLAEQNGYAGEVWNCRNGDVEGVVLLDDSSTLKAFESALKKGPGRVDSVVTAPTSADENFDGFRVSFSR
jgi:acylphosphatase